MNRNLLLCTFVIALFSSCQPRNKAIDFLLSNRHLYDYIERTLVDSTGNRISYSPYEYETLYNAEDTLELLTIFNTIYEKRFADSLLVTENFIRKHARRMVDKWQKSSHYQQLSWNDFLEYWLPYRVDGEKFCDYYVVLSERYAHLQDSLQKGKTSIIETTNLLEQELRTWLKFDLRAHALLNKPSILETINSQKGGCNTLTEFTCMALRTIGIVATIDECPIWGHRNSGHQWNVIQTEKRQMAPFQRRRGFYRGIQGYKRFNQSTQNLQETVQ